MKKLFSLLTLALLTSSAWAGTYAKVTSTADLTDGTYLIVYEAGNLAFDGSLATLDAASNTFAVTIENSTITTADDTQAFTIDMTAGTIKSASGFYIGQTTDANGMKASADEAYVNTISIDDEGNAVIVASGKPYLRYNASSGQERFRYFKSSTYTNQKAIALYKLGGTVTPPVEPTYTEVTTLAQANALDSAAQFIFKGNAVVTYQNGKYLYLRDGSGYGLIFNKTANIEPTFNNGTVLAQNWTATKTNYQGYAEYIDYSTLTANGTDAELAAPQVITALDASLLNAYVQINNVVSISGSTATLSDGTTIALYNTFATIPTFENGNYYITGIVSQYKGNLQLLLIDTDYEAPVEDDITTLAQAKALTAGTEFTFKGNVVVAYKHGSNLWLRDASGSALAYSTTDSTIVQGSVIAPNWGATVAEYLSMPEFKELTNFNANGTQEVLPFERTTITMDNYAEYVIVKGLKFVSTSVSGNHTNYVTEDGLTVRDNYDLFTYDANATYDITGIVTAYNGVPQLYITSYVAYGAAAVATPVITPNGGQFTNQVEVSMSYATEGAEIIYTINNGDEITYNGPFTLTESATVKAYAQTDDAESEMATAEFTIVKVEEATYTLVTDASKLADGDKIIIVNANVAGEARAMGAAADNKNFFNEVAVTIADNLTITTADANVITLGANGDNWTLKATEGYLAAKSSSSNNLTYVDTVNDNAIAAIAIADTASIVFQGDYTRNVIRYNAQYTRFSCYGATNTQAPVYIYKLVEDQPEVKLGDVNKDGVIRIDDVTALIDALLGGNVDVETDNYSPANADVNQDTFIRIDDVTALIDMLLSGAAK
ncbi:MAG: chitobiase/beta-hexosaminidase C-terminal domain-containing protein [Muribaculaceae bacterium]|nr:chitobiase/beta-hexosaminidase C-terminal domain-containing protein [Muribaculaceae bacterium]